MPSWPKSKVGLRAAIAVVAVYALLLNALFSASVPFVPSPLANASICGHEGTASDQPDPPPHSTHDELCCIAACGMSAAVLPPDDFSDMVVWSLQTRAIIDWEMAAFAPSPLPNAQASPRGPPSRI
jgi:hypothetical protein